MKQLEFLLYGLIITTRSELCLFFIRLLRDKTSIYIITTVFLDIFKNCHHSEPKGSARQNVRKVAKELIEEWV